MSRFGYTDNFTSGKSNLECAQVCTEILSALGAKPQSGPDGTVTGKLGSGWKIRLLGALIAPIEWFPIKLTASVAAKGHLREVTLRVEENFGFGSLIGVEKKVRDYCDRVGLQFSSQAKQRLA